MEKKWIALALACLVACGTFGAIAIFAENAVTVSSSDVTQIVFGDIFTGSDKGKTFDGNLYVETTLGPAYFDGVRQNDWFTFKINVQEAGDYHFCFSFGWPEPTGTYSVSVDGGEAVLLQNTVKGLNWRDWCDSSEATMALTAGEHTVKVVMGSDGPNIYSMKIAPVGVALSKGGTQYTAALGDEQTTRGAREITHSAAVQFNSTVPFSGVALASASWNNNIGSLRFSLYKWDGSYNKTLRGEVLATEDFIDFVDNVTLKFLFDEVEAGEYLLYIENITGNVSESVGSWGYQAARTNIRSYADDSVIDFCPALSLMYGTDVADPFAAISEADPNASSLEPSDTDLYTWGDPVEYDMDETSLYGVQFNTQSAFKGFEVYVTTVPSGENTLTLELYKWATNYSTTVRTTPVQAVTHTNVSRNSWVALEGDFEAGEYLLVVKNGTSRMTVGVVETTTENVNHYLHTSKAGVSLVCRLIGGKKLMAPSEPAAQDFISTDAGTWVATDGLDRVLPTVETTGEVREGKYVGIFYHTWHSAFAYRTVVNVTELLQKYPEARNDYDHPAWNGETNCFWNEPLWGYYNNGIDRWVLRKQAELLADAGVDVVIFDNTNGTLNFVDAILTLCEVWAEARADGVKTPQISAMLNMYDYEDTAIQIKELYDEIYSKGLYQDLWFYWEGKPLLLGYPDELLNMEDGREAFDFFSYRPIDPSYNTNKELILQSDVSTRVTFNPPSGFSKYTKWKWISIYPQEKMRLRSEKSVVEEMCVSVAQNWSAKQGLTPMNAGDMVFGRGYTNEFGINTSDEAVMYGLNFAEQWEYALEVDPTFIFITGWNEWQVGRTEETWGYENGLPDNATDGYSRDIEPSTGMLKDHFYNQMVAYIRRFKGTNAQTPSSGAVQADSAATIDWSAVTPVYRAYEGNTLHRDYDGYSGYHYTNTTGRNDFVESRVTYDEANVYFMVKTAEDITPYTDAAWMRLLIDMVGVEETDGNNWETFEYIVNRTTPTASKAVLERSTGGWNWEKVAEVDYTVDGDTMVITVPREALGISVDAETFSLNFKWSDNMQTEGDIMDFYVSGDVAPGARFKYSFTSVSAQSSETEIETTAETVFDTDPDPDPDETTALASTTDGETDGGQTGGCKSVVAQSGMVMALIGALAGAVIARKRDEERNA